MTTYWLLLNCSSTQSIHAFSHTAEKMFLFHEVKFLPYTQHVFLGAMNLGQRLGLFQISLTKYKLVSKSTTTGDC